MKLQKYVKIVKEEGYCAVYRVENGFQWLGTREALYNASALPDICSEQQAAAVFDLTEKQMDKVEFTGYEVESMADVAGFNLQYNAPGEQRCKKLATVIVFNDTFFSVLQCDDGELVFYNESCIAPMMEAAKSSEYFELRVRKNAARKRYIVAFDGFEVLGGIMPVQVDMNKYMKRLAEFESLCAEQLEREEGVKWEK